MSCDRARTQTKKVKCKTHTSKKGGLFWFYACGRTKAVHKKKACPFCSSIHKYRFLLMHNDTKHRRVCTGVLLLFFYVMSELANARRCVEVWWAASMEPAPAPDISASSRARLQGFCYWSQMAANQKTITICSRFLFCVLIRVGPISGKKIPALRFIILKFIQDWSSFECGLWPPVWVDFFCS